MPIKLAIAATVAVLSLATTAFAAEGNGDPFPFRALGITTTYAAGPDVGSQQYPAADPALSTPALAQATLPENGQNGPVETANSLPLGAMDGTVAVMQAQSVQRWYAEEEQHRFAAAQSGVTPKG